VSQSNVSARTLCRRRQATPGPRRKSSGRVRNLNPHRVENVPAPISAAALDAGFTSMSMRYRTIAIAFVAMLRASSSRRSAWRCTRDRAFPQHRNRRAVYGASIAAFDLTGRLRWRRRDRGRGPTLRDL